MPKVLITRAVAVGAALSGLLAAPAFPAGFKVVVYLACFFVWSHLDRGGSAGRAARARAAEEEV
jgi:hypothetical protein